MSSRASHSVPSVDENHVSIFQAFGQDEGGQFFDSTEKKCSAWNDVGIDPMQPESGSGTGVTDKDESLRPPTSTQNCRKVKNRDKRQLPVTRKRPRNISSIFRSKDVPTDRKQLRDASSNPLLPRRNRNKEDPRPASSQRLTKKKGPRKNEEAQNVLTDSGRPTVARSMEKVPQNGNKRTGLQKRRIPEDNVQHKMDPSVLKELDSVTCFVCEEATHDDSLVLCDACYGGCHIFCMRPKRRTIPLGAWLCPGCHQAAKKHDMPVSQMVDLRWFLNCLECYRRNDPDMKLDCDIACATCKIAFHSACLLLYKKATSSQLKNPGWKCPACVQLPDSEKAASCKGSQPNRINIEHGKGVTSKTVSIPDGKQEVQFNHFITPDVKNAVPRNESRVGRESTVKQEQNALCQTCYTTERSGLTTVSKEIACEAQADNVEIGAACKRFVHESVRGQGFDFQRVKSEAIPTTSYPNVNVYEEEEVLDGSGLNMFLNAQSGRNSYLKTDSSRWKTSNVSSLLRSSVAEQNLAGSKVFKRRKREIFSSRSRRKTTGQDDFPTRKKYK